jgi:hypothetical protein
MSKLIQNRLSCDAAREGEAFAGLSRTASAACEIRFMLGHLKMGCFAQTAASDGSEL